MYHSANISDPKGAKRDKSVMLILLLEWRKRRVRLIIWLLCVAVPSDSLPSIMAVSSSSPYLLLRLLLISSLSWVSTAFLMDRDGATSSSRSPPSLHRQKNWDWPLSADPGAHQTLTSVTATLRTSVLLTFVIMSCVRSAESAVPGAHVEMFTVEQTPRVPGSSNRLIDKDGVNIWSEVFCQSPGTGWCRMSRQLTQPWRNHHTGLCKRTPRLRAPEFDLPLETPGNDVQQRKIHGEEKNQMWPLHWRLKPLQLQRGEDVPGRLFAFSLRLAQQHMS